MSFVDLLRLALRLWVSLCAEPSNINPAISSFFSYLCLTSYFLSLLAILKISFILVDTRAKKKTDIFPDSSSIELKPRSMPSLLYTMKPIPAYIPIEEIHAAATCWWACHIDLWSVPEDICRMSLVKDLLR